MKENMKALQETMCKYYNKKVANKERKFQVVDWVLVNAKNFKTKRTTKKLDYKLRGKLQIEKLLGTCTYRLNLPPMAGKIHTVFCISLLEPYHANTILQDVHVLFHPWILRNKSGLSKG